MLERIKSKQIDIYVLLLPELLMLDVAGPAEVFNFASRYGDTRYKLHFIGPVESIETSIGMSINVAPLPSEVPAQSWLLLPGLEGAKIDFTCEAIAAAVTWLADYQRFAKVISVCAGTLLLAKGDALTNKQCTTHHSHLQDLEQLVPSAKVQRDRLFVQDGAIYTSAGVTAGIDLALYIVEQTSGVECAAQVARNLVLFSRRTIQEPAQSPWLTYRNHLHQGVHNVQDQLQKNPSKDWRIEELAAFAYCSPRHLARIFKANTDISCKGYLQQLRMSLARQLLYENRMSVESVAIKVGYNDVRQFRRIWQQYNNAPPACFKNTALKAN